MPYSTEFRQKATKILIDTFASRDPFINYLALFDALSLVFLEEHLKPPTPEELREAQAYLDIPGDAVRMLLKDRRAQFAATPDPRVEIVADTIEAQSAQQITDIFCGNRKAALGLSAKILAALDKAGEKTE
jgi:hypothetical protein